MIDVNLGDIVILNPTTVNTGKSGKNVSGKEDNSSPLEIENPGDVPRAGFDDSEKERTGIQRSVSDVKDDGKQHSTRSTLGEAGTIFDVSRKWEKLANAAVSRSMSGMSDVAKGLLRGLISNKPKVNWKKELKKFFDWGFSGQEDVLPNRRFIGRGDVLYGTKPKEKESVRTLVVAVDTSGSISKKQGAVFLNECNHLCKMFDFDEMIVIYCSDDIGINGKGGIEKVKRGQKIKMNPDGTPHYWLSTGGNDGGFAPPFAWCQNNRIVPSAFIYLTDTGADYPSATAFGIPKYKNKVFWFICTAGATNLPPFGRYAIIPMDYEGNFT